MTLDTTFNYIVLGWISLAIIIFPITLQITAPYGRHISSKWGPLVDNRMGWILMELPALLTFPLLFLLGDGLKGPVSWIFFGLWLVHYLNRTLIFPLRTHTKGKHIPLFIVLFAVIFNVGNGYVNGQYLGSLGPYYEWSWLGNPRFTIGAILFIAGLYINWQSDNILLHLRKPGETDYKIPHGGLFRYVSCPNHFGEILEWIGFACMTWSLPALSFALWTFVNLVPRALDHHKWYLRNFEAYPKDRKAVIPFLW